MKNTRGFGIVEVIVAVALFVTIAVSGIASVVGSFTTNRLGEEQTEATAYAQQGLEAARSIKNQGWDTPFLATPCESGCGISTSGSWAWLGTNNTSGKYTRTVTVSEVSRLGNGDIADTGGTLDPETKKVTAEVTWSFSPLRTNVVILSTYMTNWGGEVGYSTCSQYCVQSLGYVDGVCRQSVVACSNNGENYESGGDTYCTAGANADTCCCSGPTPTPSPTGNPTPTPTTAPGGPTPTLAPTPVPSCVTICTGSGYSTGTCRQNVQKCSQNGETHVSVGNPYCTGGANVDTCCCAP